MYGCVGKCLVLVSLIAIVENRVPFRSCGSTSTYVIQKVLVNNCSQHASCTAKLGSSLKVDVQLVSGVQTNITTVILEPSIEQRGAQWDLVAAPTNFCDSWKCPFSTILNQQLDFSSTLTIDKRFVKGNSGVFLRYKANQVQIACVNFDMQLL